MRITAEQSARAYLVRQTQPLFGLSDSGALADTRWVARLHDIVIDCAHPASLARFWAAALDGYAVAPYDEAEIDRLRSLGVFDLEDDPTVLVEGPGPRLLLQRVPERKRVKNRIHVDLAAADLDSEVQRLAGLGASVVETYDSHAWLTDPQGTDFCVTLVPSL